MFPLVPACDQVGFRLAWAGLGLGWVCSRGDPVGDRDGLLLLSGHATPFAGCLPGRVAGKRQCWATTCCPVAWTGGSSSSCVLLELLSAGKVVFVQGFWCCLSDGIGERCFTFFPTQVSWGKNELYLPFWGAKFPILTVYRGIKQSLLILGFMMKERHRCVGCQHVCERGVVLDAWCFQGAVKWGIKYKIQIPQLLSWNSRCPRFLSWQAGVCFVFFFFLWAPPPTVFQWWSSKGPPVSGALGAVPSSGSSSSPFSIFPWRVAGGAAASGLLKGLSPGGWGVQEDALHRSETWQGPSSSFWEPPALKCLPNMCEVPSGWGRYRRESHSPVPPCSVSPLFPQPLLAAAAELKVLKTTHFYCTAPFRLPGSFMLWAEWHVSLFWGKNRF